MEEEILDSLAQRYAGYSDEELVEILKKHKYYQPEAASLAISEAIKRGLINSEDDLFAPGFRHEPPKFSLFPRIEKPEVRKKLIRSLARIILFVGLLPVIYGVLKIAEGNTADAVLFICFGALWLGLSIFILINSKPVFTYSIFGLAIVSLVYAVKLIFEMPMLKFTDIFVTIVIFGVVFYNLIYITVLTRKSS